MNPLLFLATFLVLLALYSIVGFIASRRVKTISDYFVAGRDLSLLPVTFTLIATQLGGGMLLGTSQEAYSTGIYGILYTLGMSLGFLLLGSGFAARLQSLNINTTAELFEKVYHSKTLKQIASILSVITLSGILISQIVGSKSIALALNVHNEYLFAFAWFLIIVHTMAGGLRSVVLTDTMQVLFIIMIFGGIFLYSVMQEPWNMSFISSIIDIQKTNFGTRPLTYDVFFATLLMPALFSLIEQDLAQRFFAARTRHIAALSALCAGFFMICFSCIPIYFGMKAKLLGIPLSPGMSPLIPSIEVLTNEFVIILATVGIIAAIVSTADSLLCAISSNIAQDFNFDLWRVHDPLKRSQIITLCIGIVAFVASYFVPQNIISILIESYAISVNCLLVPLVVSYFTPSVKKYAAWSSVIAGFVSSVLFILIKPAFPHAFIPLLISACAYIIGALCTE